MRKLINTLFTILLLLVFLNVSAQVNQEWVKTYNHTGNSQDIAYGIAVDNSGNSYVTGSIVNGTQRTDYATIKYNSSGTQEWLRIYNGTSNDLDYARDIVTDTDGNIYVTGLINFATSCATIKYSPAGDSLWVRTYIYGIGYNIATDANNNIYVAGKWGDATVSDYWVIKYNSGGAEQWMRKYNGSGNGPDVANALVVDNSGNVYVTGSVYVGPFTAIATVKYNSAGVQQWDAIYDCPGFGSDVANSIDVDNSGNVFITGFSDSTTTGKDIITIKYNSSGARQWVNRFHDGVEEGVTVKAFDENNIYVTGPSLTSTRPDDFTIIKYNSSGVQQWMERYNGNGGGGADRPNKMVLDGAGNIYICGQSQLTGSWEDLSVVKYNSSGLRLWDASFTGPDNYPDTGLDMALDNSGNVFVTGRTYTSSTAEDYITIKYSQTTGIQQISEAVPDNFHLSQNYPNPFNPATNVEFGISKSVYVSLKVYDLLGKEAAVLVNSNLSPGNYKVDFDASALPGGVYFYKLRAGEFEKVKKMVLLK